MTTLTPKLNHTKDWYAERLRDNICVVVFEKTDGTERTMICTTKSDQVPPAGATTRTVTVPDHQVRTFDIQKQEWRSFNVGTVISFDIVDQDGS
ncbi:MAG: DUF2693 domain-containing protein [Hydrotalea sp. AMD]|uniref:SH3 beta-barrel fold-containing protein n=1 Tax=Hydrotalea sp. AMD TaxID=2501297 RepID=UPI001025BE4D|nr:SH3 beta-barrel fold-containing protein [Hydrotalea sp. AMD]RWZ83493.1 MAG: DUF2693 domain-containing protein [Hydrotalea sp. AMD]